MNQWKIFGRMIVVLIIGLSVFGYWKKYSSRIPACLNCNVIVISLDQVRAKTLPCFGYSQNTAPNLCAFAAKSRVFTNAYTTASRTHDAHFSMITGLYPSVHTMTLPYASMLPDVVPTFAGLMKNENYRTYFFGPVGDPHLPLTRGMERGFDATFNADDPDIWITTMDQIATDSAAQKKPAFYFMHTYIAHEPYMPTQKDLALFYDGPPHAQMSYEDVCSASYKRLLELHPDEVASVPGSNQNYCTLLDEFQNRKIDTFESFNDMYALFNDAYWHQFDDLTKKEKARFTHALYAAQIYELDKKLGKFFAYLSSKRLLDNTMIVIVGDQGDEFFEHDSYSHGWSLYEEVLHVPFIVYVPGSRPAISHRLVSVVDILPTVFDVIGDTLRPVVNGLSVFSNNVHSMILAEHVSDGALKLITDRYTLIRRVKGGAFDVELYDRKTDPGEQRTIFKNHVDTVKILLQEYKLMREKFPVYGSVQNPLPTWLKDSDRENLIKSGYF